MNQAQYEQWLKIQERQAVALEKIAHLLNARLPKQPAPNYQAALEKYKNFDWASIDAKVEFVDKYGVASVIWEGERYKRRSPSNVYGTCIFFSRCIGEENGKNQYERLITFNPIKKLEVQAISRKAEELIN